MKKILLFLGVIFILSISCSACGFFENPSIPDSINEIKAVIEYGIDKDDFNWKYDLKATDEEIVDRAEAIMDGKIYVESSFPEAWECRLDQIDWEANFSDSPGTFQLYLQALNPISYLAQAYYINGKEEYLYAAKQIVESWMQYKNTPESEKNPYLWYDHGTAIRSNNLIYFLLAYMESKDFDADFSADLFSLLQEHGMHLTNEDEYFENHNHGIFQDQALIYLAFFLNSEKKEEWIELAEERLIKQKEYAFSSEMVHVENSPAYQIGVTELFYQTAEFLTAQNDNFGEQLYQDVTKSLEFMSWAIKPNGILAEMGDTSSVKGALTSTNYSLTKYGDAHLSYAATMGKEGEKPEALSAVYSESGYYFGRSGWEGIQDTWTMFKAGYLSKTHKHADDLSLMLYSKGYDILVDPGWYNYMIGDKYRDYFVSSKAHSTVIVDGKTYSPTVENSYKTGIYSYEESENWDYVIGYSNMYDDVQIDRHFLYGGDVIVIIDDISAGREHEYSQLFQLSEYMTIESAENNEVVAAIGDSGYKLRIHQMVADPSLSIINGEQEDAEFGHLSRTMNDVENINTLKWDMTGKDVVYVTVLMIEDSEGKVLAGKQNFASDSAVQYDLQNRQIIFNGENEALTCTWSPKEKYSFDAINIAVEKNRVLVENQMDNAEEWSYAWYLVDMDTSQSVEKISYCADNKADFMLVEDGIYLIKAYVRSLNGRERMSRIVAAIQKEGDVVSDVTDKFPYLNLDYVGHDVEQISDDTWRFTVNYNYSWNSSISWYIYKNGGIYFSERTSDTNFRDYQFNEPGSYTVMYYLRTSNGDNEFWNFSQIVVE